MSTTIHPFQNEIISLSGEIAQLFSFNRSIGQLYGLLYTSHQPLSLEEIARACRMSKGNASIHLRTLESWNAVNRSWKTGMRQVYYSANFDLRKILQKRFQEGLSKRLDIMRRRLNEIQSNELLTSFSRAPGNDPIHQRLREADALLKELETGLSMLPKLMRLRRIIP